jgi:hypothetical protein
MVKSKDKGFKGGMRKNFGWAQKVFLSWEEIGDNARRPL